MRPTNRSPRVFCFATQGTGHGDESRIKALLEDLQPEVLPFDRQKKLGSAMGILRTLLSRRPDVVVMEGTGVAGGAAVIAARVLGGIRYVVSSGDAVAPFVGISHRRLAPFAAAYERLLCRLSAGFIGWTPYLVGRALTFGATRGMTAAGWSPPAQSGDRQRIREEMGISPETIVFGLVGHLNWADRIEYCYGRELVDAIHETQRVDVRALIIGDGSGLEKLRSRAGEELGQRTLLPGAVPRDSVPSYLAAMDVGVLPQSVDGVGSFRYTIKVSEYLRAGLPVAMSQTPMSYDLDDGWVWRLSGSAPWESDYVSSLAALMDSVSSDQIEAKRGNVPTDGALFDRDRQRAQVSDFILEILAQ